MRFWAKLKMQILNSANKNVSGIFTCKAALRRVTKNDYFYFYFFYWWANIYFDVIFPFSCVFPYVVRDLLYVSIDNYCVSILYNYTGLSSAQ
jgi:hypothetical protein